MSEPVTLWMRDGSPDDPYEKYVWFYKNVNGDMDVEPVEYRALPADEFATLTRDLASARTALAEARRYVEDNAAGRFVPSNGASAALLARIDALVGGEGGA